MIIKKNNLSEIAMFMKRNNHSEIDVYKEK